MALCEQQDFRPFGGAGEIFSSMSDSIMSIIQESIDNVNEGISNNMQSVFSELPHVNTHSNNGENTPSHVRSFGENKTDANSRSNHDRNAIEANMANLLRHQENQNRVKQVSRPDEMMYPLSV